MSARIRSWENWCLSVTVRLHAPETFETFGNFGNVEDIEDFEDFEDFESEGW